VTIDFLRSESWAWVDHTYTGHLQRGRHSRVASHEMTDSRPVTAVGLTGIKPCIAQVLHCAAFQSPLWTSSRTHPTTMGSVISSYGSALVGAVLAIALYAIYRAALLKPLADIPYNRDASREAFRERP